MSEEVPSGGGGMEQVLVAVGSVAGTLLTVAAAAYVRYRTARSAGVQVDTEQDIRRQAADDKREKAKRREAADEAWELYTESRKQLEEERKAHKAEMEAIRRELADAHRQRMEAQYEIAQLAAQMESREDLLRANDIPFRTRTAGRQPGTDNHRPVHPAEGKPG